MQKLWVLFIAGGGRRKLLASACRSWRLGVIWTGFFLKKKRGGSESGGGEQGRRRSIAARPLALPLARARRRGHTERPGAAEGWWARCCGAAWPRRCSRRCSRRAAGWARCTPGPAERPRPPGKRRTWGGSAGWCNRGCDGVGAEGGGLGAIWAVRPRWVRRVGCWGGLFEVKCLTPPRTASGICSGFWWHFESEQSCHHVVAQVRKCAGVCLEKRVPGRPPTSPSRFSLGRDGLQRHWIELVIGFCKDRSYQKSTPGCSTLFVFLAVGDRQMYFRGSPLCPIE